MPWLSSQFPLSDHAIQIPAFQTVNLSICCFLVDPLVNNSPVSGPANTKKFLFLGFSGCNCSDLAMSSYWFFPLVTLHLSCFQTLSSERYSFSRLSSSLHPSIERTNHILGKYNLILLNCEERCNFWKLNLLVIKNPAAATGLLNWSETRTVLFAECTLRHHTLAFLFSDVKVSG